MTPNISTEHKISCHKTANIAKIFFKGIHSITKSPSEKKDSSPADFTVIALKTEGWKQI